MTVRLKIALTIAITGALTALGVLATVIFAFQAFEHETTYHRANAFLDRVVGMYDDLFEMHARQPEEFDAFLRNLVLFEPDTQLYLLDAEGTVLASTGSVQLPPGFRVAIEPVRMAVAHPEMPYVMGDDPERMDADACVAARELRRPSIHKGASAAGYLYLVAHQAALPGNRWVALRSAIAVPALATVLGVVLLATLLAWWVIATVTRPLRQLSDAVDAVTREGLQGGITDPAAIALPEPGRPDELGRLAAGFRAMLQTLREQWEALRRMDHFRREGVSNLSHDLRSPLTATAACLETLEGRWSSAPAAGEDRRLLAVALRNTRNAARMVQSLGDLAQLDEPSFRIQPELLDVGELLDDIAMRFGPRAQDKGVGIEAAAGDPRAPVVASLDIELFERAVANLVDNALKFCRRGDRITLSATAHDGRVEVVVADTGPGIPEADLAHLFDRFYQARQSVAPATGEGGKGLGLAIVKRIAELHGGSVAVDSRLGEGTAVRLRLPSA